MISFVIPTWNEEGNVTELAMRINSTMSGKGIPYEIIFIDDHSTDKTVEEITLLTANRYPIRFFLKKGHKGKAFSIVEGIGYVRGDIVVMIDADLQYPPEVVPDMIERINAGDGVVVAKRDESNLNPTRKIVSKSFKLLFGKILHGLDVDVQSGLKAFRREIAQRIKIDPTPWTFDLNFLLQARDAGYSIGEVDILFADRKYGESKVNIAKTSWEIGKEAVKSKIRPRSVIPMLDGNGFHYKGKKYVHHSNLDPAESALFTLSGNQKVVFGITGLILAALFLLDWHRTIVIALAVLTVVYFTDLLFNLFLIGRSLTRYPEIKISPEELDQLEDSALPTYSILCPLYKEGEILPQFLKAMADMDYPKDKLQVLLLLEEDDKDTVNMAKKMGLPSYFEIVVVPHSFPKTKPKACNYGLKKVKGEYAVIYDAEDVPETDQLKKAVVAFRKLPENVICAQAKLNFYNPHQNILTKLFTAEYSLWFDLVLTGLQSINAPIPLGGTSNHFRTNHLNGLSGWDPFNVTEDCDLGMRLAKNGYVTSIIDSVTWEEANSSIPNWFNQRTRWIKGYIQTYLVHLRNPKKFASDGGWANLIAFQLIVGGKIWSMFINPIMWTVSILYFAARAQLGPFIESFFPAPVFYMAIISMVVGNFLYLYYYMIGVAKREQNELIKYAFLVPFYWLFMSAAAWVSLYKLVRQPYHWSKTKHGLHLKGVVKEADKDEQAVLPTPNWNFNQV